MDIKPRKKVIKKDTNPKIEDRGSWLDEPSHSKNTEDENLLGLELKKSYKGVYGYVIALFLVLIPLVYGAVHKDRPVSTSKQVAADNSGTSASNDNTNIDELAANAAKADADVKAAEANVAAAQAAVKQAEQNYRNVSSSIASNGNYSSSSSSSVAAPTRGPSAWSSNGPGMTGTYYYKISYVDNTGNESNLSPSSLSVILNNQQGWISSFPASPSSNVSQIKLYRTLANGGSAGPYYLLNIFNGNSSRIYFDSTPDSDLYYKTPKY